MGRFGYLDPKTTLFLLCDVQDKHRAALSNFEPMLLNTQKLLNAGRILNVDLIAAEQHPDMLCRISSKLKTSSELNIVHAVGVYPKLAFSMAAQHDELNGGGLLLAIRQRINIQSIVLFGLEAHICVEQTAMDLLNLDYEVHVVADCTISRSEEDRRLAFERLRQIGCFVNTSESVIFKLLKSKDNPAFAEVRALVAEISSDTGLAKL